MTIRRSHFKLDKVDDPVVREHLDQLQRTENSQIKYVVRQKIFINNGDFLEIVMPGIILIMDGMFRPMEQTGIVWNPINRNAGGTVSFLSSDSANDGSAIGILNTYGQIVSVNYVLGYLE